jgi:4-aminobutyrate aminotransferase-like enzyme
MASDRADASTVIRLIPPLNISKEETADAIRILSESLYEVAQEG